MASSFPSNPPAWFKVAAIVLILWGLMGCASLYMHFGIGPGPDATDYDRKLYAAMPMWLNLVYIGAVACGLLGAIGLFLRRSWAVLLSALSLILVVIQFGWMFLATDIIAVKGAWVTYFPAFIFVMQAIQLYVANKASKSGWLR
ncbi:sugar transporter [Sphingomonas sp. MG17]|uniref:Sugar transporter n=1 Tax=Sphingomonas tagetis TaxID=2949092 RepID=A0A9X2HJF6_9SPHN|nr:sugar transporter [Sphingomonas tagetis]MCP3730214.1 sugar transporter [Sphingomonas tagetis]